MKTGKIISAIVVAFLSICLMVAPVFALELSPGNRVILRANNPQGVPLHETSAPSLIERAATGTVAEVSGTLADTNWIEVKLPDGDTRWVVERYIGEVITAIPDDETSDDDADSRNPNGTLFPNLSGEALSDQLAKEFDVENSLGYDKARDYMFSELDNDNGVVRGVYSGFEWPISPNSATPRQDAYQNGRGLNTEHSWPQSKGAKGVAKSDLHHLFPAQVRVNSSRGSSPFAEIDDSKTRWWFIDLERLSSIPGTNIDDYSEATAAAFEPREQVKGDIARAQFYFYTIYRDQAEASFFKQQQDTLCAWNKLDPVDESEKRRSQAIAVKQGNENPFVIDPSLANRLYCNN
ncbi:MAG: hypothetical protein F6K39_28975 [Okeania sp. SIO3B3]|nr:hypothetical protein [Okeania sp. SIO3B3]